MGEVVSLRDYMDMRFDAQEQAVAAALAAAEKAVAKAEAAAERRFESQNEFRGTLTDQARTFMPRAEAEQANEAVNEKLIVLNARVDARENRGRGMGDVWGIILGIAAFAAAAFAIIRG